MVDATSNNPPLKAAYIRLGVKNQFSIDKSLWTCFTEKLYEYKVFGWIFYIIKYSLTFFL